MNELQKIEKELDKLNREIKETRRSISRVTDVLVWVNEQRFNLESEHSKLYDKLGELKESRAKIFNS